MGDHLFFFSWAMIGRNIRQIIQIFLAQLESGKASIVTASGNEKKYTVNQRLLVSVTSFHVCKLPSPCDITS